MRIASYFCLVFTFKSCLNLSASLGASSSVFTSNSKCLFIAGLIPHLSLPAGDGKVSFVDVRDIAFVAATVLTKEDEDEEHKDKAYDVTGPESLTYSDAANILSIEAGKKIGYSNISEDDARQMIKEMGMSDWHTNVLLELLRITREGYLSNISSAVEKVTGNRPIAFQRFAKDYASAFQ